MHMCTQDAADQGLLSNESLASLASGASLGMKVLGSGLRSPVEVVAWSDEEGVRCAAWDPAAFL